MYILLIRLDFNGVHGSQHWLQVCKYIKFFPLFNFINLRLFFLFMCLIVYYSNFLATRNSIQEAECWAELDAGASSAPFQSSSVFSQGFCFFHSSYLWYLACYIYIIDYSLIHTKSYMHLGCMEFWIIQLILGRILVFIIISTTVVIYFLICIGGKLEREDKKVLGNFYFYVW